MTRAHDMGGRFGDGPVIPEPEEERFHAEWHKRALAVTLASNYLGQWNLDISRHARERLAPTDYARFSYYEKWMAALADLLVETQVTTRAELSGEPPAPSPLAPRAMKPKDVPAIFAAGSPVDRSSDVERRYDIGAAVQTVKIAGNRFVDGGHTRLPNYAAGARGRILRYHGTHILPDANGHRLGERPEPLYAVIFPACELWAHPEHPNDEVVLDLWQSYLEPAS